MKRPKTVPADLPRARDLLTLMKPRDSQLVEIRAPNCRGLLEVIFDRRATHGTATTIG
jgi:hypothetical protein